MIKIFKIILSVILFMFSISSERSYAIKSNKHTKNISSKLQKTKNHHLKKKEQKSSKKSKMNNGLNLNKENIIEKFNKIYKNNFFFITDKGVCFHREHCGHLKVSSYLKKFGEINANFAPCSKCFNSEELEIMKYFKKMRFNI